MLSVRRAAMSALGCVSLSACGSKTGTSSAAALPQDQAAGAGAAGGGKVLNLYIWSDYLAPNTLSDFEKQTGIKVHVAYFDTNETLETKLLAGSSGYDIVVPTASYFERQIKAGVYLTLDKSKLPNLKNMDPQLMARVAMHRSGQRARRDLHVGHERHRLQREDDPRADARCAARQLAAGVRSGGRLESRQVRHQRARLAGGDDACGAELPRHAIRTPKSRRISRRRRQCC